MPKMPKSAPPDLIVIAWYTRENFDRIRTFAKGGGGMHATFDEWLKNAQEEIAGIIPLGIKVIRFEIDPEELRAWLRSRKVKSNEQTRALFVHETYSARISTKH
jgi:hypothetical protein